MKQPRFSILHPTARVKPYPPSLPFGWQHACHAFWENCLAPDLCEYIVVVHESRWEEFMNGPLGNPREFLSKRWKHYRIICNQARDCFVDQINRAGLEGTGQVFIGVMDDCFPCADWDKVVYDAFPNPDAPAVLHFSTGSPRDRELIVGGAVTKAYYDKLGYLMPPEFESMYADDYMTRKWRADGVVIERLDIRFDHRHPAFGTAAMDPIYELQNRSEAYRSGKELFTKAVASQGWGAVEESRPLREAYPMASPEFAKRLEVPRVVACLLPGEQFSHDWVVAWTILYGRLLQNFEVHPHFGHTSNVYVTRLELAQSVLEVEPHADLIVWIDDDNIVTWEHLQMLLKDLQEHPEADAVCGWCWIYNHNTDTWLTSCGRSPTDESMMYAPLNHVEVASGEMFEVQASGFPLVIMRYSMLAKLGARAFVPIVDERLLYGFSSEDAAFWQRATAAGCKLLCDTRVRVEHMKTRGIQPVFVAPNQSLVCLSCGAAGGSHLETCRFSAVPELAAAAD